MESQARRYSLTIGLALLITMPAIAQDAERSAGSANRGNPISTEWLVSNWLRMDKDGDERVSEDEAEGQVKTSFDRNDADRDGFLVRSEIEALAQRRRGDRNQTCLRRESRLGWVREGA